MDDKVILSKVALLAIIDGILPANSLDLIVKILQVVFYAVGIYVMATTVYDYHLKNKEK